MNPSLFKNTIYKLILNAFNLVLPIFVGAYVARTLGATSMGKVQFSETIFMYFFIFATFGVYQYGMREMSRVKGNPQKVSQLFTSLFTISTITSLLSLGLYILVVYTGYGERDIFPILLLFSFNFLSNIFYVEWANEALERYGFITVKTVILRLIYAVLIIVFIQEAEDYIQYTILLVLFMFLNNIVSFVYVKRHIPFSFSNLILKKHIKPLFLMVIFSNASILYTQLDRFMLGEFSSASNVSYYVVSQQIMGIINMLMLSVVQVTIPRLSYLAENEGEEAYISVLNQVSKVYFSTLFPAAFGLFLISDVGVVLYGGAEFTPAGAVLAAFALYMITLGMESILSNQIMYIKEKEHILVRIVFIGGIVNLILNTFLVVFGYLTPLYAVLTTVLANAVLVGVEYWYIRTKLKVAYRMFEWAKLKYFVYSFLFLPASYPIKVFIENVFVEIGLLVIVNASLYVIILFVTKDEVLYLFINKMRARLKRS
jgi:O-antigen/teichoic acid export membrane protein